MALQRESGVSVRGVIYLHTTWSKQPFTFLKKIICFIPCTLILIFLNNDMRKKRGRILEADDNQVAQKSRGSLTETVGALTVHLGYK